MFHHGFDVVRLVDLCTKSSFSFGLDRSDSLKHCHGTSVKAFLEHRPALPLAPHLESIPSWDECGMAQRERVVEQALQAKSRKVRAEQMEVVPLKGLERFPHLD